MQIRLSPANQKALVPLATANKRTPTAEANLAIEQHLNQHRERMKRGPKLKK